MVCCQYWSSTGATFVVSGHVIGNVRVPITTGVLVAWIGKYWLRALAWVDPQLWGHGEWFLLRSVGGQQLPCFAQSAQGWPIRPKPSDPISDPILDPDSVWRFRPHHSTLRNRIPNWISESDPKLDPSISVLGRKIGRQIGHQVGHTLLCIIGRTSGHPIGLGFGLCLWF